VIGPRDRRTQRIVLRVTPAEKAEVVAAAAAVGLTVSDHVRARVMAEAAAGDEVASLRAALDAEQARRSAAERRAQRVLSVEAENERLRAKLARLAAKGAV